MTAPDHRPGVTSRRDFLRVLGLATGAGLAAACSQNTAAPAPTGGRTPPSGSAPTGAPALPPGEWQTQWNQWVEAAKREGAFTIATFPGDGYYAALAEFEKAYGIAVEHQRFSSGTQLIPKLLQERSGNVYSWDVVEVMTAFGFREPKDAGAWDPVRPILIHPDALDDSKWQGGFEAGWLDKAKDVAYGFNSQTSQNVSINTDLVRPGELTSIQDLLDPKWRGKFVCMHPSAGQTYGPMTTIRLTAGEDAVKQLMIDQQPTFMRDLRQITEAMVRGRYAIATGVSPTILQEFLDQGLGRNVKIHDIPGVTYRRTGVLWLVNRAPHPNAARVFMNWLLTREGQSAWSQTLAGNSRRIDVPPSEPTAVPVPGRDYIDITREDTLDEVDRTRELLNQLVP